MNDIHALGLNVYVWVERTLGSPPRPAAFLGRWPAVLSHLDREEALRQGVPEATHVLVGPIPRTPVGGYKQVQSGDLITRCVPKDGVDYVRPGKPWKVIERRHERGYGTSDHQAIYLREEV